MAHRTMSYGIFSAALLAAVTVVATSSAQNNAGQRESATSAPCIGCSADGKTTPRTADGHPDFSGLWGAGTGGGHISQRGTDGSVLFDFGGDLRGAGFDAPNDTENAYEGFGNVTAYKNLSQPPYKPEYMAKVKYAVDKYAYGSAQADDPMIQCRPDGIPRAGGTMQFFQTPQAIAILYEASPGPVYRIIYTDGRPHVAADDFDSSYFGDSIGHWEGDTLVVDTVGLNDETWLGGGFGGPKYARQHSDQEHVVERWTRAGDQLTYEATVEDPVMFSKPWVITPRRLQHAPAGARLLDQPCIPNDAGHIITPTEQDPFLCNYGVQCVKTLNDTSHIKRPEPVVQPKKAPAPAQSPKPASAAQPKK